MEESAGLLGYGGKLAKLIIFSTNYKPGGIFAPCKNVTPNSKEEKRMPTKLSINSLLR